MKVGHSRVMEKIPKTKDEIQRLILAELRTAQCEKAWGIALSGRCRQTRCREGWPGQCIRLKIVNQPSLDLGLTEVRG
jgi:hypothetical protein